MLAFVRLAWDGERSFSSCRTCTADVSLQTQDVPSSLLDSARILRFGSISLTDEPAAGTTCASVARVKENGALISYDPNLRPRLRNNLNASKEIILSPLSCATF